MKREIYGRKVNSGSDFALLIASSGVANKKNMNNHLTISEFELTNLMRQIQIFRSKNIEGYVLLEGDSKKYEFSPTHSLTFD